MERKALFFSVVAVAGLVLLVAVSAVTASALAGNNVETTPVEQAVEVAPPQAEPVGQVKVFEPAPRYEPAKAEGKSGCSYSSTKLQMTEAPAKQVEEAPLAQLQR
jgi:hypothetical protein